jgi:hypothetical protein
LRITRRRTQEGPCQRGFACAERSLQQNAITRPCHRSQSPSEVFRRGKVGQGNDHRGNLNHQRSRTQHACLSRIHPMLQVGETDTVEIR